MKAKQRKIVIGDVHGQYDALMQLLAAVSPGPNDRLCFVGDLIDRGPKSAHVVDFVMNSSYDCLLGNHEKMLLDIFRGGQFHSSQVNQMALQAWLFSGGQATLMSYEDFFGEPGIPSDHLDWMRGRPLYLDWDDFWVVHAGVDPSLSLEMQGDREFCWIREPFHSSTRPYFADKTIVTGHTITFTLPGVTPGNLAAGCGWIDIDTGAYHPRSGWLTAVDLSNEMVYQMNVYQNQMRRRSLTEAITHITPEQIVARH